MKRYTTTLLAIGMFTIMGVFSSCNNGITDAGGMDNGSGAGSSHNAGRNCMTCHKPGGSGSPNWTFAGTIYNPAGTAIYAGATVLLYDRPDGAVVAQATSDASGNFHTTSAVDFSKRLYPVVRTANGDAAMTDGTTTGACNSCHGVSTGRITVR